MVELWLCIGLVTGAQALAANPTTSGLTVANAAQLDEEERPRHPAYGKFRFVGGAAEQRAIEAAIEEATADMALGIRGIARERLTESIRPYDTIALWEDGNVLTVAKSGETPVSIALGAESLWVDPEGTSYSATVRVGLERVTETLTSAHTTVRTIYEVEASDGKLRARVKIVDERIPGAIYYTLTYAPA